MQEPFCDAFGGSQGVPTGAPSSGTCGAQRARAEDGGPDGFGRIRLLLKHLCLRSRVPQADFGVVHRAPQPRVPSREAVIRSGILNMQESKNSGIQGIQEWIPSLTLDS